MLTHLQTAAALILLLTASVFGQAGVMQCLCTGQITLRTSSPAPTTGDQCADSCCQKHQNAPKHDQFPSPCDDGLCYLLVSLDAVDPPAAPSNGPTSQALAMPSSSANTTLATFPAVTLTETQAPPDRRPPPLTILYSSFLI